MTSMVDPIIYEVYSGESQMPPIIALIEKDLSEPYSIFTYRYFINNWPNLCYRVSNVDWCGDGSACIASRMNAFCSGVLKLRWANAIYTFVFGWVQAMCGGLCVGTIVCKADDHRGTLRGYIAMLAVDSEHRKRRIGKDRHRLFFPGRFRKCRPA